MQAFQIIALSALAVILLTSTAGGRLHHLDVCLNVPSSIGLVVPLLTRNFPLMARLGCTPVA